MASTGVAAESSNGGGLRDLGRGAGRSRRRGGQAGSRGTKVEVEGRASRSTTRVEIGMALSTAAAVIDLISSGDETSGVDSGGWVKPLVLHLVSLFPSRGNRGNNWIISDACW